MSIKNYLSLVKFSHTVFAMPFALIGYFLAVSQPQYSFNWKTFGLVILAMVFARKPQWHSTAISTEILIRQTHARQK